MGQCYRLEFQSPLLHSLHHRVLERGCYILWSWFVHLHHNQQSTLTNFRIRSSLHQLKILNIWMLFREICFYARIYSTILQKIPMRPRSSSEIIKDFCPRMLPKKTYFIHWRTFVQLHLSTGTIASKTIASFYSHLAGIIKSKLIMWPQWHML